MSNKNMTIKSLNEKSLVALSNTEYLQNFQNIFFNKFVNHIKYFNIVKNYLNIIPLQIFCLNRTFDYTE